jgi:MFS family permease
MTAIAPSPPGVGRAGRQGFIAALGIGQICSWGALYYAFPLIAEQIERETGWSRTSLYGAATAGLLIAAAASFPLGRAIDRGHGRAIMTGGSVLAGLVMLAWSQVSDLVGLYVIVGLLGVLQAATLYEAAFAVAARCFGAAGARDAIVAVTLWAGFASTVFIPLIQLMIDLWGWRGAVTALGVINLVVCAGLYGWAIRPERDLVQRDPAWAQAATGGSAVRQAMASPVFWSLTLAYTAHAAVFTAFTFHLYPLLLERGF